MCSSDLMDRGAGRSCARGKVCNAGFGIGDTRVDVPQTVFALEGLCLDAASVAQRTRIGRDGQRHRSDGALTQGRCAESGIVQPVAASTTGAAPAALQNVEILAQLQTVLTIRKNFPDTVAGYSF
mgnify:CR=1 FL=1